MSLNVSYKVFSTKKGEWGYDIYVNNSLFIRQNSLPVVRGNVSMRDEEVADKLARTVVNKINQGKHPAITLEELREMNISLE